MIQYTDGNVTVFQSALFQTTTTIVETKDLVLLADPAWLPHEVENIKEYVNRIQHGRKLYLLFTHGDFDHIIGYGAFPNAITIGSAGLRDHPEKQRKIQLIEEFDKSNYIERQYPIIFPEINYVIEQDRQQITIGETTITCYLSPGHTQDGLFTIVEPAGVFIAGDYLSDIELPFIYYGWHEYEQTLEKADHIFDQYNINLLVPGHGRATTNRVEMKHRVDMSRDYLARLKEAVVNKNKDVIEALALEFRFPSSFTKQYHDKNVEILKKELNVE